jgi:hypothetical protein
MRNLHRIAAFALLFGGSVVAQVPEIGYDSATDLLKWPDHVYMGEPAGVARNSKGDILVYTRSGTVQAVTGASRTFINSGSRLFEFDSTGKFLREFGQGLYGLVFAQSVKVDPQDNIWVVDRGSSLIMKFSPEGRILMVMGRKPEAVTLAPEAGPPAGGRGAAGGSGGGRGASGGGGRGRGGATPGAGAMGDSFDRPTDVTWDAQGNIFVSDGYANSRVAKFDKNGKFIKSFGYRGAEAGQFNIPHSIAVDAQGNLYVADLGNKRIQVFDNDGTFKTQYTNVGAPWAICISPGPHQYLYSSNSNDPRTLDNGEIYKMELGGQILGKFGKAGKLPKEFGTVNEIDCRNPNELLVGEELNWRVQKITLRPGGR